MKIVLLTQIDLYPKKMIYVLNGKIEHAKNVQKEHILMLMEYVGKSINFVILGITLMGCV